MTDLFGNYQSQSTLGLKRIDSSKYPDTNKDFEANIRRLNSFVDYIGQYLQQMQKGVDDANKDPLTELRDTITNLGVLFGGGELLYGINLGDLQYYLPALAALFGFDTDQPFPLNLLYAAEHFLLGYIIPLDSWNVAVEDVIDGWLIALGFNSDFIAALHLILDNLGRFTGDLIGIFNAATGLLGAFDIFDFVGGPIGPIWSAITTLLGSFNIATLGSIANPFLQTLTPWLQALGELLGLVDDFLETFTAGLDTNGTGGLSNISNWLSDFLGIFGSLTGLGTGTVSLPGIGDMPILQGLFGIGGTILTSLLNVPAGNIFGLIPSNLLGFIQAGNIGNSIGSNLLATVADPPVMTANGTQQDKLTDDLIVVSPNQKLDLSGLVSWTGGVGTGSPIQLGVTEYLRSIVGTVENYDAAGQANVDTQAIVVTTSGDRELNGTYTVPSSGVDAVRVRVSLTPSMTAGVVSWNSLSASFAGLMHTSLIEDSDGNGLPDILEGHGVDIASALSQLVDKVSSGDFDSLLSSLGGTFGSSLLAIETRLADFLHSSSILNGSNIGSGSIDDGFVPGVISILDNIFSKIRNITLESGQTVSHSDVADALQGLTDTVTGLGAKVSQFETIYTSGVSDGDDFERAASTLGSGFTVFYTTGAGTVGTPNGHDASWQPSGIGSREWCALRATGQIRSAGNNQRVTVSLGSSPGIFFGTYGANDVWLRVTDDTTSFANITGIRIRFEGSKMVRITRFIAGVAVELNSINLGDINIGLPGPGAIVGGEAGKPGTGRYFKAIIGGSGVVDVPEVGTASAIGPTACRWGLGGRVEGRLLPIPGQTVFGTIRQWNVMDQ